jgi:hypothetical protein
LPPTILKSADALRLPLEPVNGTALTGMTAHPSTATTAPTARHVRVPLNPLAFCILSFSFFTSF